MIIGIDMYFISVCVWNDRDNEISMIMENRSINSKDWDGTGWS